MSFIEQGSSLSVSLVSVFCGGIAGYSEYVLVISPGLNFDRPQSRSTESVNTGLMVNVGGAAVVYGISQKYEMVEDVLEVVVNVVEYVAEVGGEGT